MINVFTVTSEKNCIIASFLKQNYITNSNFECEHSRQRRSTITVSHYLGLTKQNQTHVSVKLKYLQEKLKRQTELLK